MPAKDPSRTAKRAVDATTNQAPAFNAETILESGELRARLRDAKEALAKERAQKRAR